MAKGASALLKSSVSTFRSTALTRTSAGDAATGTFGVGAGRRRAKQPQPPPQSAEQFRRQHLSSVSASYDSQSLTTLQNKFSNNLISIAKRNLVSIEI
jgi:hypothetical protein